MLEAFHIDEDPKRHVVWLRETDDHKSLILVARLRKDKPHWAPRWRVYAWGIVSPHDNTANLAMCPSHHFAEPPTHALAVARAAFRATYPNLVEESDQHDGPNIGPAYGGRYSVPGG